MPRRYMLTPSSNGVTLVQVEDGTHGMSFIEAREVVLSIYKDCVLTWKTLTEDEFIAADIVEKYKNQRGGE